MLGQYLVELVVHLGVNGFLTDQGGYQTLELRIFHKLTMVAGGVDHQIFAKGQKDGQGFEIGRRQLSVSEEGIVQLLGIELKIHVANGHLRPFLGGFRHVLMNRCSRH